MRYYREVMVARNGDGYGDLGRKGMVEVAANCIATREYAAGGEWEDTRFCLVRADIAEERRVCASGGEGAS